MQKMMVLVNFFMLMRERPTFFLIYVKFHDFIMVLVCFKMLLESLVVYFQGDSLGALPGPI